MVKFLRDAEIENQIGLSFRNLTMNIDKDSSFKAQYDIYGEFDFDNKKDYSTLELRAIFFDENDNILKFNYEEINLDGFLGHGTLHFSGFIPFEDLNKTKKIKIIPTNIKKKLIKSHIKSKDKLTLKSDDLALKIFITKDYSSIYDEDERKNAFIGDIVAIIDEFSESDVFDDFINNYEG